MPGDNVLGTSNGTPDEISRSLPDAAAPEGVKSLEEFVKEQQHKSKKKKSKKTDTGISNI